MRPSVRGWMPEAPWARLRELQSHHQPRYGNRGGFTDTCRVRQDDVSLKLSQIGGLDAYGRQLAEAGVDAVDRLAAGHNPLDRGGARGYPSAMGWVDGDPCAAPDRPPVGKRRLAGAENDSHLPLQTRA